MLSYRTPEIKSRGFCMEQSPYIFKEEFKMPKVDENDDA